MATAPAQDSLLSLIRKTKMQADAAAFLVDRQAGGCSVRTLEYYRDELHYLTRWLAGQGVTDALHVTPDHLRRYLLFVAERRNPGGVHCAYRVAKTFLRWWGREYEPDDWRNPIERVKPPKLADNPLPPVPLPDLQSILNTCDRSLTGQRDRAMLLALLDTGCRASEFVALDIGDVDLGTGAVVVRHGKGGKRRVVFLGAKSRRELLRYLRLRDDGEGALWTSQNDERLQRRGLQAMVRRRAERAGVPVPALHSFRRANALLTLRGGADLLSVSRLLGHSDLGTTRRYLKLEHDDLAEAHRKAGPVDRHL